MSKTAWAGGGFGPGFLAVAIRAAASGHVAPDAALGGGEVVEGGGVGMQVAVEARGKFRLRLAEAGWPHRRAFVAPHDQISAVADEELARGFDVISTGWFEWRRLPAAWRWRYVWRRLFGRPHWRIGRTQLLSHPGCLLSYHRPPATILPAIQAAVARLQVTVLVTHWWEYFRAGAPDCAFIRVLHETAGDLAAHPDLEVIRFEDLAGPSAAENKPATPDTYAVAK